MFTRYNQFHSFSLNSGLFCYDQLEQKKDLLPTFEDLQKTSKGVKEIAGLLESGNKEQALLALMQHGAEAFGMIQKLNADSDPQGRETLRQTLIVIKYLVFVRNLVGQNYPAAFTQFMELAGEPENFNVVAKHLGEKWNPMYKASEIPRPYIEKMFVHVYNKFSETDKAELEATGEPSASAQKFAERAADVTLWPTQGQQKLMMFLVSKGVELMQKGKTIITKGGNRAEALIAKIPPVARPILAKHGMEMLDAMLRGEDVKTVVENALANSAVEIVCETEHGDLVMLIADYLMETGKDQA